MMNDHMTVFVNGTRVVLYRGMCVKHALIALESSLLKAAEKGELIVRDDRGFRVGLEGGLQDGAKLYTEPAIPTEAESQDAPAPQ